MIFAVRPVSVSLVMQHGLMVRGNGIVVNPIIWVMKIVLISQIVLVFGMIYPVLETSMESSNLTSEIQELIYVFKKKTTLQPVYRTLFPG